MKEIEFKVPRDCDLVRADALIEKVCAGRGLELAMKGSLAKYPGCIHWHFQRPNQKGTLELTLHRAERRIWVKVQEGRKAPWIVEELPALRRAIERGLKSLPKTARPLSSGAEEFV
ncbi:MAG TPA: hypothetical protein VEG64_10215 [Candidatus Sulfotelmatobacter sp.]|nr:hypothetical protein [Candidatus Sulfotelmatobacter sp.]